MLPVPFTEYSLKTELGEVNSTEYSNECSRTIFFLRSYLYISINIFFCVKNHTYGEKIKLCMQLIGYGKLICFLLSFSSGFQEKKNFYR